MNLFDFTSQLTIFIAHMPTTADTINPTTYGSGFPKDSDSPNASLNSSTQPARIVGIPSINEYLTAVSREKPLKSPPEIVEPERDTPGKSAIA